MDRRLLQLIAPALVLACIPACMGTQKRVGKAPTGERRQRDEQTLATRRAADAPQKFTDKREVDAYAETLERERRLEAEGGSVVVGLYGTKVYHRSRCPIAYAAAQDERVTFVSVFDSLDAGYRPCTECEPGP